MAGFNGSGSWSRSYSWTTDYNNGVSIDPTRQDTEWANATSGFNTTFCRDGQAIATGNWNLGGFKIANYGTATARTDVPNFGQIQDGGANFATTGGTANAITLSLSPAITAYTPGTIISFIASGDNTTNVTVNINGVGVTPLVGTDGSALVAGEIKSGMVCLIECKTAAVFQLLNKWILTPRGKYLGSQVFTSNGTYTPNASASQAIVEVCAGGGAGGGATATSSSASAGYGGQSGGYCRFLWSSLSSQSVTIGGAGSGISGNPGGSGGNTVFGSVATCNGGTGGQIIASSAAAFVTQTYAPSGGGVPASITGGTILSNVSGSVNMGAIIANGSQAIATSGGNTPLGGGGIGQVQDAGTVSVNAGFVGHGFGAGGGGGISSGGSFSAVAGGAGKPGIVIVHEYS